MRISDWSSDVCSSDLTRAIAAAARAGRIDPDKIEAADVDSFLDTRDLPPPDLIVRTSGEVRLSNFMLWQAAYAELLFVDTLWPDFDADALAAAVESFAGRDRRYGALRSEERRVGKEVVRTCRYRGARDN